MTQTKKANTLMEKFGFMDPDLATPKHDALMVWLDQNVESILLSRYPSEWGSDGLNRLIDTATTAVEKSKSNLRKEIEEYKRKISSVTEIPPYNKAWPWQEPYYSQGMLERCIEKLNFQEKYTLGDIPRKSIKVIRKQWEKPISTKTSYTVGFIDMALTVSVSRLSISQDDELPKWNLRDYEDYYFFEVKPSIQSVGEVVRQVRLYQQHITYGEWIIVSPDDRFAKAFEDQGIGFIKVPSEKITLQNNAPPADMLAFIKQVFEKMEARGQCVNPEWQGWLQRNAG